MSYQKEREEFIAAFCREFPAAGYSTACWLLRQATASQRYNEIATSIDVGQAELDRLEARDQRRDERVRKVVEGIGGKLETNGDPRGVPYKIVCPSGFNDSWGSRGLCVPGRGLPARCFA